MNDYPHRGLGGWQQGPGLGGEAFPGIGESLSGPPALANPQVLPAAQAATKAAGGFSLANLSDLKSVIDRMGGIEGVLSTVGKVQKFMSTMQQVAPIIKLFMNKGKSSKTKDDDDEDDDAAPRRRRRRVGSGKSRRNRRIRRNRRRRQRRRAGRR
ncbi:hypothetical protein ACFPVX_23165 [Cohnella faecalis]|uniref:Tyrosine protein kinase n=1 Tax=Cohnella faecalis TaxID=2315694 RepID=A0A398CJ70_9BACL|nr:hypothetical protein [Cohnella faecalis]RIE02385.1 hypothetical protein D3H35_16865 [Cohnella faecalis]